MGYPGSVTAMLDIVKCLTLEAYERWATKREYLEHVTYSL